MSRYDMYRLIHKGLRALSAEVLVDCARLDAADLSAVDTQVGRVRYLLDFCQGHLEHEDRHVHPAMEARAPGSTATVAADHLHHGEVLASLRAACDRLEAALPADRADAAHALYLELSVFVGENLVHMHMEETHNNAILWDCYSDDELRAIEGALVADLTPAEMTQTLRWMVPAATPDERAAFLSGLRQAVPMAVFDELLGIVTPHLSPSDLAKLGAALSLRASAA